MRVKCNKLISYTTKEDLGDKSPWVKKNKEYVVLAMTWGDKSGMDVFIQSEDDNEPIFMHLDGFEIVSQKMPSNWITVMKKVYDETFVLMLPERWNYEMFTEDLEDQKPEAIAIFREEAIKIYREEGVIDW